MPLDKLHSGTLQPWVEARQRQRVAAGTINHGLKVVRRILNLAALEWVDENGLTWLSHAPKIKLLPDKDKRPPYPLDWDEQVRLLKELPGHLAAMALFAINTGCRDQEVCRLCWEWEVQGLNSPHPFSSFQGPTLRTARSGWLCSIELPRRW